MLGHLVFDRAIRPAGEIRDDLTKATGDGVDEVSVALSRGQRLAAESLLAGGQYVHVLDGVEAELRDEFTPSLAQASLLLDDAKTGGLLAPGAPGTSPSRRASCHHNLPVR
jgi:hypothetical protein